MPAAEVLNQYYKSAEMADLADLTDLTVLFHYQIDSKYTVYHTIRAIVLCISA